MLRLGYMYGAMIITVQLLILALICYISKI